MNETLLDGDASSTSSSSATSPSFASSSSCSASSSEGCRFVSGRRGCVYDADAALSCPHEQGAGALNRHAQER